MGSGMTGTLWSGAVQEFFEVCCGKGFSWENSWESWSAGGVHRPCYGEETGGEGPVNYTATKGDKNTNF
ncbi:hypothetical protein E2C01_087724 [Portunus trituberculatus]|uniref:Uncharacterized protein n=1 Tax=Portunus trituberculatus TaxID=210409 RepID=A0A5B7JK54_PORTR|nr:hypothetical protein [Portunus trituberculatus]